MLPTEVTEQAHLPDCDCTIIGQAGRTQTKEYFSVTSVPSLSPLWFHLLLLLCFCYSISLSQCRVQLAKGVLTSSAHHINSAAALFGIHPRLVAGVIFVEQVVNVTWVDRALDVRFAEYGLNTSVGIGQVKVETAEWIEENLKDTGSLYFLGDSLAYIFPFSQSRQDVATRLNDAEWNARYVAANLAMITRRWADAGVPLTGRPEILATLYSTGVQGNGAEKKTPHGNPLPNDFGRFTKEFFDSDVLMDFFPP